jgi:hypothetical protein
MALRCAFTFNCYKHWGTLLLCGKHNRNHVTFLFSKEGITQGDPLSNVCLRPWDPTPHLQTKGRIQASEPTLVCGQCRSRWRLPFHPSLLPTPTRDRTGFWIVSRAHQEQEKSAFADLEFQITTSSRYLGGFIGEEEALHSWLEEKTSLWTTVIHKIALASKNFP